jgi:hypothetical protein
VRGIYLKTLLFGSLFALPAGLMLAINSFWPDADLLQPNGFYLGSDFANYWTGGRLALQGRLDVLYDFARYNALLHEWFSPHLRLMNFSYPPHALFLLAIFGAFPYLAALLLWSLAGAIGFIAVALGRRPHRGDGRIILALALSPILWVNIVFGQFGLLLSVLFVGALRALPARLVLAGLLIGLLTIKPQLGLLLPLLLLLLPSWRALAAAVISAVVLVALSLLVFGVEPWQVYVTDTMPFQWHFIEVMDGFYRFQMVTPYTALWFCGLPVEAALALQGIISLLVAVATCAVVRSAADYPLKATVVAFGSVLMVPYVLAYDLAIPLAALVWYLSERASRVAPLGIALVAAVWALPFALCILFQTQGLPVLPLVLLVCFGWLVSEALGFRRVGLHRTTEAAPVKA